MRTRGPAVDESETAPETRKDDDDAREEADAPAADAGTAADAGKDAAPPGNAFTGAPAYASKLGPTARKTAHPFTNDNPAGRPCFNCHGGDGAATPFAFAGTVYQTAGTTTPAPRVEVRVRDTSGKARSAWTDADGNFFFTVDPDGDLVFPAQTGIRDGSGTKLMKTTAAEGDCNGCHNPNGAGRLIAP